MSLADTLDVAAGYAADLADKQLITGLQGIAGMQAASVSGAGSLRQQQPMELDFEQEKSFQRRHSGFLHGSDMM